MQRVTYVTGGQCKRTLIFLPMIPRSFSFTFWERASANGGRMELSTNSRYTSQIETCRCLPRPAAKRANIARTRRSAVAEPGAPYEDFTCLTGRLTCRRHFVECALADWPAVRRGDHSLNTRSSGCLRYENVEAACFGSCLFVCYRVCRNRFLFLRNLTRKLGSHFATRVRISSTNSCAKIVLLGMAIIGFTW